MRLHSQVCQLTPPQLFSNWIPDTFFKAKKRQNVSLAYICGDFVQVHYRANFILQVLSEFTYMIVCYCSC